MSAAPNNMSQLKTVFMRVLWVYCINKYIYCVELALVYCCVVAHIIWCSWLPILQPILTQGNHRSWLYWFYTSPFTEPLVAYCLFVLSYQARCLLWKIAMSNLENAVETLIKLTFLNIYILRIEMSCYIFFLMWVVHLPQCVYCCKNGGITGSGLFKRDCLFGR